MLDGTSGYNFGIGTCYTTIRSKRGERMTKRIVYEYDAVRWPRVIILGLAITTAFSSCAPGDEVAGGSRRHFAMQFNEERAKTSLSPVQVKWSEDIVSALKTAQPQT